MKKGIYYYYYYYYQLYYILEFILKNEIYINNAEIYIFAYHKMNKKKKKENIYYVTTVTI
jgi:hypothetical protein